jgi:hypothetical protein
MADRRGVKLVIPSRGPLGITMQRAHCPGLGPVCAVQGVDSEAAHAAGVREGMVLVSVRDHANTKASVLDCDYEEALPRPIRGSRGRLLVGRVERLALAPPVLPAPLKCAAEMSQMTG